MNITHTN